MPRDLEGVSRDLSQEAAASTENVVQMLVEVWNTARIDLGDGAEVSLKVDEAGLARYFESRIEPPMASDAPTKWKNLFDLRPRPVAGSVQAEDLEFIAGRTWYEMATILINVAETWRTMSVGERNPQKLKELICEIVVHETEHAAEYCGEASRKRMLEDQEGRGNWRLFGRLLPVGIGSASTTINVAAIGRLGKKSGVGGGKGNLTRRDFLKLAGGAAVGGLLASSLSPLVGKAAGEGFDRFIDPSHRAVYAQGENWQKVADFIQITEFVPPTSK